MPREKAFTLIELLIVLLVLGTLTTIAIPMFQGMTMKARAAEVLTQISKMERELDMYIAEYGWGTHMTAASVSFNETIVPPEDSKFYYNIGASTIPGNEYWDIYVATVSEGRRPMLCERALYCDGARYWYVNTNRYSQPMGRYLKDLLSSLGERVIDFPR